MFRRESIAFGTALALLASGCGHDRDACPRPRQLGSITLTAAQVNGILNGEPSPKELDGDGTNADDVIVFSTPGDVSPEARDAIKVFGNILVSQMDDRPEKAMLLTDASVPSKTINVQMLAVGGGKDCVDKYINDVRNEMQPSPS